ERLPRLYRAAQQPRRKHVISTVRANHAIAPRRSGAPAALIQRGGREGAEQSVGSEQLAPLAHAFALEFGDALAVVFDGLGGENAAVLDRKSTRLNSSHVKTADAGLRVEK